MLLCRVQVVPFVHWPTCFQSTVQGHDVHICSNIWENIFTCWILAFCLNSFDTRLILSVNKYLKLTELTGAGSNTFTDTNEYICTYSMCHKYFIYVPQYMIQFISHWYSQSTFLKEKSTPTFSQNKVCSISFTFIRTPAGKSHSKWRLLQNMVETLVTCGKTAHNVARETQQTHCVLTYIAQILPNYIYMISGYSSVSVSGQRRQRFWCWNQSEKSRSDWQHVLNA